MVGVVPPGLPRQERSHGYAQSTCGHVEVVHGVTYGILGPEGTDKRSPKKIVEELVPVSSPESVFPLSPDGRKTVNPGHKVLFVLKCFFFLRFL